VPIFDKSEKTAVAARAGFADRDTVALRATDGLGKKVGWASADRAETVALRDCCVGVGIADRTETWGAALRDDSLCVAALFWVSFDARSSRTGTGVPDRGFCGAAPYAKGAQITENSAESNVSFLISLLYFIDF